MKHLRKNGTTGEVILVKLLDVDSPSGAGKTGLTPTSAGLRIASKADVEAASVVCTGGNIESPSSAIGTYQAPSGPGKCRFRELDATNHPGIYEIFLPNARFAVAGARSLLVSIRADGTTQADLEYELTLGLDVDDAVRGGMTALPNVACGQSGGLLTSGAGANQLAVDGSGGIAGLASVQDLLQADRVIDTASIPWCLVLIKQDTGALGEPGAVELLRHRLYDVAGSPVAQANTILGRSIT